MLKTGLIELELSHGLVFEHIAENQPETLVWGFSPEKHLRLPARYTHFGVVLEGEISLHYRNRRRPLVAGDYFCTNGPTIISGSGLGAVTSIKGYRGMNVCGGPIEDHGRLRYINGSTDTILVSPVKKGDPCFNHLHFPPRVSQTAHTHPSIRVNVVYRGSGLCLAPEGNQRVSLRSGYIFVMLPETIHSFETGVESMDVITFHPDSDVGMTDDNHPMVNRTMVDNISASHLPHIRTK